MRIRKHCPKNFMSRMYTSQSVVLRECFLTKCMLCALTRDNSMDTNVRINIYQGWQESRKNPQKIKVQRKHTLKKIREFIHTKAQLLGLLHSFMA